MVDDSTLVRKGIRTVLAQSASKTRMEICGEAASAAEALELTRQTLPDLILLDIRLPDGHGFNVCREILESSPDTRILMLTAFNTDNFIYGSISSGAHGYLLKEIAPEVLIQSIEDCLSGKSVITQEITGGMMRMMRGEVAAEVNAQGIQSLSPQERRVLELVADGRTNKEIGESLKLSGNTVKNYLANVFDKLKVRRRSQAAAMFIQHTDT
ncbi:MAG: response regulator transcription factor [Opitutaceae bacterium]